MKLPPQQWRVSFNSGVPMIHMSSKMGQVPMIPNALSSLIFACKFFKRLSQTLPKLSFFWPLACELRARGLKQNIGCAFSRRVFRGFDIDTDVNTQHMCFRSPPPRDRIVCPATSTAQGMLLCPSPTCPPTHPSCCVASTMRAGSTSVNMPPPRSVG